MNLAEQLADTLPPHTEPQFPKRCACGRTYDAETWKALRYVGAMPDGAGGALELRDCVCHSTIAIEVP